MARTTGPLLSMDASGSVGNSITFAKWKGRNYVRRYAVPANPRSVGQTSIRTAMKYYTAMWKNYQAGLEGEYTLQAQSQKISPFNAFTRAGMKNWKSSIIISDTATEVSFGTTSANMTLTGTSQPRGITWSWGETLSGNPMAWILAVREAADPGVTTQYAVFAGVGVTSWLQTGLKGSTTYQGRISVLLDDGTVVTRSTATSVSVS